MLIMTGELEKAQAMLTETVAATPHGSVGNNTLATNGILGRAYMKENRYADAERTFLTSIALLCDNAAAMHASEADELKQLSHEIDPFRSPDAVERPLSRAFAILYRLRILSQVGMKAAITNLAECMAATGRSQEADALLLSIPARSDQAPERVKP